MIKFEKARQMLSHEKDVEEFIQHKRVVNFLLRVFLNDRQQMSVPFFQRYVVRQKHIYQSEVSEVDEEEMDKQPEEFDEVKLWEDMDLAGNAFDRQIMHEISRRKIKEANPLLQAQLNTCYSESSSEEDIEAFEGILAQADRPFWSINDGANADVDEQDPDDGGPNSKLLQ